MVRVDRLKSRSVQPTSSKFLSSTMSMSWCSRPSSSWWFHALADPRGKSPSTLAAFLLLAAAALSTTSRLGEYKGAYGANEMN